MDENSGIPLIFNPKAGSRSRFARMLERVFLHSASASQIPFHPGLRQRWILRLLKREGLNIQPIFPQAAGHAREIARDLAAKGCRRVLVAGGDGTINDVINGLAGTRTCLGVIPIGTANVLATELGIPVGLRKACRTIARGRMRTIDLGKANGKYFAVASSLSYDAVIIERVHGGFKYLFGGLSFVLRGLYEALFYSFPLLTIDDLNGRKTSGYLAIVSNGRRYGGHFIAASKADMEDGLLDVLVMKKKRVWNLLAYMDAMRKEKILEFPDVESFQCRKVLITSSRPVPVHVDAEISGATPCEFEAVPAALRILVPE